LLSVTAKLTWRLQRRKLIIITMDTAILNTE